MIAKIMISNDCNDRMFYLQYTKVTLLLNTTKKL